jgi:hypothetical protein
VENFVTLTRCDEYIASQDRHVAKVVQSKKDQYSDRKN